MPKNWKTGEKRVPSRVVRGGDPGSRMEPSSSSFFDASAFLLARVLVPVRLACGGTWASSGGKELLLISDFCVI